MKVLITGGAGFIGTHTVNECLAQGHDVVVVDNLSHGRREVLPPDVRFYELPVENPAFADIVLNERPQAIIHLAAQTSVSRSVAQPIVDTRANVLGTINVLDAARLAGVGKVVLASSAAVYGIPQAIPIKEDHPLHALSPYGAAKITAETYARLWGELYGIPATIFRYANVYGPGQDSSGEGGVVSIFIDRLLNHQQVLIEGDGEQTRDFIYVADVARANVLALTAGAGETMHVSTGGKITINELYERLRAMVPGAPAAVHAAPRVGDIRDSSLDPSRAREVIGFSPRVALEDGLRLTLSCARDK